MGVIFVVAEAAKLGFTNGDPDWCNLGQGQPEVGPIAGAPERISAIQLASGDHAYGPVVGSLAMRTAVADHYNRLYRSGTSSQYSADNVAIAAGGRLALSRLLASLGSIRVGYQTPDYTAYEDMLGYHAHRITPVLVPTTDKDGFKVSVERFAQVVFEHRLGAYLVSNPCNPTGQLLEEAELGDYLSVARANRCTLLLDEFYSHFIYDPDGSPGARPVSAASIVEDVDRDPVLIVDGLTKNFRYPGWRVGWIVGPRDIVEEVGRAASAIDGGPPTATQRAAIEVLAPQRADQETCALREVFARKRRIMVDNLSALGVRIPHPPRGTFYVWGDVSALPPPFNDAETFFRTALQGRVMVVPGRFFDINPTSDRPPNSEYRNWVRFSFGPPEDNVRLGLARLAEMISGSR
ncbi:MAG: pyridoxal phosphate-dependent aminotransferase [Vulcanimicrobiaceae bacterium]